ncbi:hypothetical protein [Robiginitomaculum antarcticum]|uniref:hypothetical protein n=1 Tax=Robiginitomaculum antarcticum TaxID=437507 RepID=UPI0012EA1D9D|nr:hypothetical protein [Robiginitomaculum antarcticum]
MSKFTLMSGTVLIVGACVTPINERAPDEIAQRSFPVIDSYTGLGQLRAPSIKQGGWARGTTATAYLQTAEPYQDRDGGAWLDIGLIYETPTANPAEMRVYNRARWAGGEPVLLADFSATVLSCEDRVQDVSPNYGSGYYGGGNYGGRDDGRYGGRGHRRGRGGDRRDRDHDDDDHDDDDDRDPGTDDDTGTGGVIVDRPRRPRRRDPGTYTPDVPENGPQPKPTIYRRPVGDVGGTPPPRRRPGRRAAPAPKVSTPVSRPDPAPVSRPAPAPKPAARPRPKKPVVSRRKTEDLKGMHFQDPNLATTASAQKAGDISSHRRRGAGSVSVNYRGYNRGNYPRRYYGGGYWNDYGPTDYVVTSSCRRREDMRIYVPRDVMQRAQGGQGLLLLLRGQNGGEREVRLSPNYITGFSMARNRYEYGPKQVSVLDQ